MLRLVPLLLLASCHSLPDAFHCTSSMQCGAAGTCEADGFCSAADTSCPSGRRYVEAGALDGDCVPELGSPSLCAGFTGLLCEGFEAPMLAANWNVYTPNATYDRELTLSERGDASGHFHLLASPATGRTYGELGDATIPATGTIGIRAFYYLPTAPPYPDSRLIAVRQTASPFQHISLGFIQNKLIIHNVVTGSFRNSGIDVPTGRWICLELVITYGQPGSVRSYLDGNELTGLRLDENTAATPPTSGLYFGIAVDDPGAATPAYDYWIDEVALDTARVGCTR